MNLEDQIRELASVISRDAAVIANGTLVGSRAAALTRMKDNVDTLAAWVGDDREEQ